MMRTLHRPAGQVGSEPWRIQAKQIAVGFGRDTVTLSLKKETNLFETSVIEYQNRGALSWD